MTTNMRRSWVTAGLDGKAGEESVECGVATVLGGCPWSPHGMSGAKSCDLQRRVLGTRMLGLERSGDLGLPLLMVAVRT